MRGIGQDWRYERIGIVSMKRRWQGGHVEGAGLDYTDPVLNGLAPRLRANEVAADKAAGKPGPEAAAAEGEEA